MPLIFKKRKAYNKWVYWVDFVAPSTIEEIIKTIDIALPKSKAGEITNSILFNDESPT